MLDLPVIGVTAPREHQRVIVKLTAGLYLLHKQGFISLEPLSEAMIDDSRTSPTPDIILLDNVLDKNAVIIEISGTRGFQGDFKKIVEMAGYYEVPEAFVYDYKRKIWRKYQLNVGEITDNPSFCNAIGYDLNEFLK